jgi:hypothetical protein
VRKVAVSLRVVAFDYAQRYPIRVCRLRRDARGQPIGRIPLLVLHGGEMLVDSAPIRDWPDQEGRSAR